MATVSTEHPTPTGPRGGEIRARSLQADRAPARRATIAASLAALLLGGLVSLALVTAFTVFGDPCPGYDDEGTMAAPASPYARAMCAPAFTLELGRMNQVPVPAVVIVSTALAVAAATMLVWRRPRLASRRSLAAGLVGVLLVQPLVVVALQVALPRDCLGGRTAVGECGRDRERRGEPVG